MIQYFYKRGVLTHSAEHHLEMAKDAYTGLIRLTDKPRKAFRDNLKASFVLGPLFHIVI